MTNANVRGGNGSGEGTGQNGRTVLVVGGAGYVGSVVMALICSIGYTVYMGYKIGAYNMDQWLFQSAGQIPFRLQTTQRIDWLQHGRQQRLQ